MQANLLRSENPDWTPQQVLREARARCTAAMVAAIDATTAAMESRARLPGQALRSSDQVSAKQAFVLGLATALGWHRLHQ
jgi:hypothetical protein